MRWPTRAAAPAAAAAAGNTIYTIPAAEMEKWEAAAAPVTEEWVKETPEGKRLHDEAVALVKKYSN